MTAIAATASLRSEKTRDLAIYACIAAVFLLSLWIRQAYPIFAVGNAVHDDQHFVRLAEHLGGGNWLGTYDNLTMAKGAAYSFLMAANQVTGLPLKLTEHAIYLTAALYFSFALGALFRSRIATLACFTLLAFDPLFWIAHVGRVVRESLYVSLSLLLVSLCARAFVLERSASLEADLREKRRLLAGLGLVGGIYWLTREEGAWLVPCIGIFAAYWLFRRSRGRPEATGAHVRAMSIFLAIPICAFAAVVGAMNAVNYFTYGVFRNNDFRSADFQEAYGSLSRISHARSARYVVFPKDARAKAYGVSAAARELERFFEGEVGETWRRIGCEQTRAGPCPEILSGWFMWALRDAVAGAGHYRTAVDAQRFYRRLAEEVNEACERSQIACGPPRATLVPPWREEYLRETFEATRAVFATLVSLGGQPPHILASVGTSEELALFERITNSRLASPGDVSWKGIRHRLAAGVSAAEIAFARIAIPASIAAWVILLVASAVLRRWHPGHVLCAALVAAIATRVGLLGFLEATSIPANNALYLSPVVPMALALPVCVIFLAIAIRGR